MEINLLSNINKKEILKPLWQDDFRFALKNISDVNKFYNLNLKESNYPIFIPKDLSIKIKEAGPQSILWKQFIPDVKMEMGQFQNFGLEDPIGDHKHNNAPQLIHRYKNRVLFLPTNKCPVICRYCFRKNELNGPDELFNINFKKTLNYLNDHPEINEIIFSGGDPLILSDKKISIYLSEFNKISHIKYIRFHTRTPIVMPSRITDDFVDIIKNSTKLFDKVLFVIHSNHRDEIDDEVKNSLIKLSQSKATLLSQSVLLANINDSKKELIDLYYKLDECNVRPYYLHHPDQVKGALHFYLPLERGRKIYSELRNELPGWLLPQYIIDIPNGEGKTPAFNPENFEFSGRLINRKSEIIFNKEPFDQF
jgi:lysine 2,3-aminomutase